MKQQTRFALIVALFLLQNRTAFSAEPKSPAENARTSGYNCLFMGHSFFHPVAVGMKNHARRAGFEDHRQQTFFAGGAKGTPGWFWETEKHKVKIQQALKTGKVDLVGMTYHPDGKVALEDYKKWVDFALQQNPKTMFFIAVPWGRKTHQPIARYEAAYKKGRKAIYRLIDGLRQNYPNHVFYCIPYGEGSLELKRLFEAGKLPDVEVLSAKSKKTAVYRDRSGHPDRILTTLSQLIWLATIYQIDLSTYDWETGYETDLKSIAAKIVAGDPYAKFTPPSRERHK